MSWTLMRDDDDEVQAVCAECGHRLYDDGECSNPQCVNYWPGVWNEAGADEEGDDDE